MQNQKRNIIMADAGLFLVALFWGGGFVAGKFALQGLEPMNLMVYRYVGAALVLLCFSFRKLKKISKKMVLCAALVSFLMFLGNTLQTIGLQYTTPGKQSFIISMYTFLVPLFSWVILKVKPSKKTIAAALIALAGIALLTLRDDLTIGLGDFLTFIFAITFSLQVIFISIVVKDLDPTLFCFLQVAGTAILSLIAAAVSEAPQNALELAPDAMAGLIYLIVFNSAFAFLLQNLCQRYAPPNHTAIILSTETVFGTIFAVTLAGEVFQGRMILGCILMFTAIIIAEIPVKAAKGKRRDDS